MSTDPSAQTAAVARDSDNTLQCRLSFFEVALLVISDEGDGEPYPPPDSRLVLTSKRGYRHEFPVSDGVRTDDDYCSFRFNDLNTPQYCTDEFTATLEWAGGKQVLLKDQKAASFIDCARKQGDYELPSIPAEAFLGEPILGAGDDETVPDPQAARDSEEDVGPEPEHSEPDVPGV